MSQPLKLDANSALTLPGGTRLRALGISGTARTWTNSASRLRGWRLPAEEDNSPRLLAAMEKLDIREQETIHLDVDRTVGAGDAVILEPAASPEGRTQVVLYQDESGLVSWHLPDGALAGPVGEARAARLRSGGQRHTFTISTRTAGAREALRAEPATSRLRGLITTLGRKVFKVLILPLVSDWLGRPLLALAQKIEDHYRHERIRALSAGNYRKPAAGEFGDWATLRGKRSLLVVHGILSSTEGMLAKLPARVMERLQTHYEGRMIALDQLTVSRDPAENATRFLRLAKEALAGETAEFDVLCHSRGGIVTRALVEQGENLVPGHGCRFRKVFFAGTPNNGSSLADPDHMVEMIDTITNLATSFPDGWANYTLELLLDLLKALVHSGERHLPGAAAMGTLSDQYINRVLNAASSPMPPLCDYAAAASDFAPGPQEGLAWRMADALVKRVFQADGREVANDLIVPFRGVFDRNGHPWFPIEKRLVFGTEDNVKHTDYFGQPEVGEAILWHFGVAGSERPADMIVPVIRRLRGGGAGGDLPVEEPATPGETLRQPEIGYHEYIEAGQTGLLTVALSAAIQPGNGREILGVDLSGEDAATISVQLSAPGFDITGTNVLPLKVNRQWGDTREEVVFTVTPRDPGAVPVRRDLRAFFWQGTALLGSATHTTVVAPPGWIGGVPTGGGEHSDNGVRFSATPRRDCELVLSVEGDARAGVSPFRLSLRSSIAGESYESRRAGVFDTPPGEDSLEKYLAEFYDRLFASYPPDEVSDEEFARLSPIWETNFLAELADLGRTLWSWLPVEFRNEYFRLHDGGHDAPSILIASEEMVLPWELVIPFDDRGNILPPLGQSHIIGRWDPGWRRKPDPQRLRVSAGCLLHPGSADASGLRAANEEVTVVKTLLPRLEFNRAENLTSLRRDLLDRADLQILHFVGHGDFSAENADESALILADGSRLRARSFTGSVLAAKASPVLYLNACAVGRTARVVGRPSGFGANFLRSGGTGVIAPYWPINDTDAAEFARAFYEKLMHDRSVGEALRELRVEHPDKSTYQAFSWFGDPWTSLELHALQVP